MKVYIKDPDAILDYAIDWSSGGYLAGQNIISSDWVLTPVEPDGLTITNQSIDENITSCTAEAGIAGHSYRLSNRIILSNGIVDERGFVIQVEQRI